MQHTINPHKTQHKLPLGEMIYFNFEQEFVEQQIRCIPMIVRFKMDAAAIKLKLADWCKFTCHERAQLALMPVASITELKVYHLYLTGLVKQHTGCSASPLPADPEPVWGDCTKIPGVLIDKIAAFDLNLSVKHWASLQELQRFALVKLCSSDHENKNLPMALIEFGLMQKQYAL